MPIFFIVSSQFVLNLKFPRFVARVGSNEINSVNMKKIKHSDDFQKNMKAGNKILRT